jgi:uncharacterized protein (TIGR03067 family)
VTRSCALLLGGLLSTIATLAPADEPKTDLDMFQGTWSIISNEESGQKAPPDAYQLVRIIFNKDRYEVKEQDAIAELGSLKLDAKKAPKTVDFKITKGDGEGKTQLGIYEINGDTLKLCVSMPPGSTERPTAFSTEAGSNTLLMVLKRKKD